MKTAGWIFLAIGIISFFGAALKGNSVFGPLFCIALGAYLLYRVQNKESEQSVTPRVYNQESTNRSETQKAASKVLGAVSEVRQNSVSVGAESLQDIQSQLTLRQREAAMCLISFFGGYNDNLMDDVPVLVLKQSAVFFGLPDSPLALSKIMAKYTDADTLIDIVISIKPAKAKEFLLLTCYDLIKSTHNAEAHELLRNIANDLGYDKPKFTQLINLYR